MQYRRHRTGTSLIALVTCLSVSTSCFAQQYVRSSTDSVRIEDANVGEISSLQLVTTDGVTVKAPKVKDQAAFGLAAISPDGRRVIWQALEPTSGVSYPVPTALVVFRANRIERVIREDQCIFRPMFAKNGSAVAYITAALHGDTGGWAHLRRLSDGKQIATYLVPNNRGDDYTDYDAAVRKAPGWVTDLHAFRP